MSSPEAAPRHQKEETPQGRAETVERFRLTNRPEGRRAVSSPALENDEEITLVRKRADIEDSSHRKEAWDRIHYGENYENLKKLEDYSVTTQKNAWQKLQELKQRVAKGGMDGNSLAAFRQELAKDREHLMQLQQYGMTLPDSPRLRDTLERGYNAIISIEEGVHAAEAMLRSDAVGKNWSLDTHPVPKKGPIDAESAALANKFNTSAKQIEKSKKSIWGRVKGWFS
ncbi:MAG: hypothetical protein WC787_01015 [Patescibacteria group bacterium]|jgi:hypothetical protein